MLVVYIHFYLFLRITIKYHIGWELNEIWLRGFFLEPTAPDLGNSSGGTFLFKMFLPRLA